jgi:sortase A
LKIFRARRYRRYQVPEEHPTRRYRRGKKQRRTRRTVSTFALILVLGGLGLVAYTLFLGEDSLVRRAVSTATESEEVASSAPRDTTLYLTVPKMARVEDLPVYDAPWDSEAALDTSASHLDSSGFPWQEGANVYITGHRMGFPGARSFLVFYDLDALENGDEILLTDSDGTTYTYEVFNEYVWDPFDWTPTEPVPGKNVITLQTCTLPDYTQRLIVQGELKKVTPGAVTPHEETDSSQEKATPQAIPQEGVVPQAIPQEQVPPEAPPEAGFPQEAAVPQQGVAPEFVPQEAGPPPVEPALVGLGREIEQAPVEPAQVG